MTGRNRGLAATDDGEEGDGSVRSSVADADRAPVASRSEAAVSERTPAGRPDIAIAVDGLSKRFGDGPDAITAVDHVSFEVGSGSIVGLLGPNGAGKTTLVKSILGMVLPDDGTVEIAGIDVRKHPRAAYSRVDAMLEGARNDYWRLTVRENLRYFATIGGIDPDSVAERHERLLEQLELAEYADTAVRDLSRGMKQKVSLASVLAGDAEVVFLDEPTLGLDVESTRTLEREIRRLAAERGLTVVLSSHNMDVIEAVCDRVLILSDGRLVADDTVDSLRRQRGAQTLEITSRDLTEAVRSDLADQFAVTGVSRSGESTSVEVEVEGDEIYEAMALLRDRGVRIDRVSTAEPDLEDVFVDLTGRQEPDR
ncbi:MAG: ATP-binding cassette domain-containing protein [Halobellus sp.]|uniref:ABC transporter ATP-binding protein n=1 Tax=Halobellus sp. TaxID=1979212 RepID=UPI0035D4C289